MDNQLYKVTTKKPDKAHANNAGQVLYFTGKDEYCPNGQWISHTYDYIPSQAIYWCMLPDNPITVETADESSDRAMNEFLKQQYLDVEHRVAMYPIVKLVWATARRFFEDARK
jgi:hypothetical protein